MPPKKTQPKKKIPYKKRPYKKKNVSNLTVIRNPNIGGFSKSVFTTLKYVTTITLSPAAGGSCAVNTYRANSLFDPDQTGVGHQPRGFDEWMTIYDHYYVKRSHCIAKFVNTDATYTQTVGICLRDDSSAETDPNDYMEQDSNYRMLAPAGGSGMTTQLKRNFNFGGTNYVKYTSTTNKGTISVNPTENSFFHVWAGSPFGVDTGNVKVMITLSYDVLFTEMKDLTQS